MTLSLSAAILAGEVGIQQASHGARPGFQEQAKEIILSLLARVPSMPGEDLVDRVKQLGVRPDKDDRAFGAVFQGLVRDRKIHSVGFTLRKKGHGTAGGRIWAVVHGQAA